MVCKGMGIQNPPSRKIFTNAIKSRAGAEQTEKMEGSKAAYQEQEHISDEYYSTPVHGDRPWQYAHLDHTKMDVKLRHSRKSRKNFRRRAWLSLLIDSRSRRVLAHYISFESPSKVSLMMVIRECVRRHGRLPECIVVDGGAEFRSSYFETFLARKHCDIQWRPPTKPRYGSIIERFIHTLNKQVLHNLLGNTKATRKVRQMTKAVDPDKHAIWTLPLLDEALEEYFYKQYDTQEHSSLGQSPHDEWNDLMNKYVVPEPDKIEYDQIFLIETMIPVKNEMHFVHRSRGITVFGTWYKAAELKDNKIIGIKVEVLYDPLDVSHVYAYVRGSWVECLAPPGVFALLRGKSVRMMRVISEEERELVKDHGRGANDRFEELARRQAVREETEREEQQRLADEELSEIAERKDRLKLLKTDGSSSQLGTQEEDDEEDKSDQEIDARKLKTYRRARRG
jgi:transposase InsO family protein